jgi:hypothetical protein
MATGRQETTASGILAGIPSILPIPGTDSMIIVDLSIMKLAEQTLVNDGLCGKELA